jgi:hypothetical protein
MIAQLLEKQDFMARPPFKNLVVVSRPWSKDNEIEIIYQERHL